MSSGSSVSSVLSGSCCGVQLHTPRASCLSWSTEFTLVQIKLFEEALWLNVVAVRGSEALAHTWSAYGALLWGKSLVLIIGGFFAVFCRLPDFSPDMLSVLLPFFPFLVLFFMLFLVWFGHTLASVWMPPSIKDRSCCSSHNLLLYYTSLFWGFRGACTLCKLNSKYGFLLTREAKCNLTEKGRTSLLYGIISNWDWLSELSENAA